MANNNEHTWQAMLEALNANQVRFNPYRGLHKDIDAIKPSFSTDGSLYFAYDDGYIFLDKEVTENGAQVVKRFTMGGVGGSAGGGSSGFVYANATMNGESPTLIKEYSDLGDIDSPSYFILEQAFHFKLENKPQNITVQEQEIYYNMYVPVDIPEDDETPWDPMPEVGTLVINTNGWIFRIVEKQGDQGRVLANLLSSGSTSGGGGGSGGTTETADLHLDFDDNWNIYSTFIEGKDFILDVFCSSDRDKTVSLSIQVTDVEHNNTYPASVYPVRSGEAYHFNTATLPRSNNLIITFSLNSTNSRMPDAYKPRIPIEVKVVQMALNKSSNVTNHAYIEGPYGLNYNIVGDSNEIQVKPHLLIDGTEIELNLPGDGYTALTSSQQSIAIPEQEHGVHQIEIYLSSTLGIDTESIFYELAWVNRTNDTPLIWFDDLPTTVINYDNCIIKYNVFNPITEREHQTTTVNLLQEREPIPNSPISVQYVDNGWLEWDISALYKMNGKKDTVNSFSIACGAVRRDFDFIVTSVGERDLGLVQPLKLSLNLSSAGRSNNEESSVRKNWSSYDSLNHVTYETTFENFNWFNNGWQTDGLKDGTFLAIANGARARIAFKPIELNSTSSTTIELRFRVRNIQEYSTLVRTIARYNVLEDQANAYTIEEIEAGYYTVVTDELDLTNNYYKKNIVNNITSYELLDNSVLSNNNTPITIDENGQFTLIGETDPIYLYMNHKYTMAYDADGNPIMNEAKSEKAIISDKGVCFKYFDNSGYGFCIGTQEAFFKSRAGTANVRYKEDEIINLSFVIAGGNNDHVLYIYLNGILSGAIDLTQNNGVESINANYFEINSDYCDFDLYKLRVYDSYLSMPEIIHNYLSDKRDIELYDQNQLTDADDATNLLYTKVVAYNNSIKTEYANVYNKNEVSKYINKLTMPYAIIQTIDNISSLNLKTPNDNTVAPDDDRLPYNKDGGNRYVKITFVNPALDEALEKGIIDENFYYTHSPSYEAVGVDINVQGTSSQGYPRRNYKTKFKSATKSAPSGYQGEDEYSWGWRYTKGSRAGESFSSWHMDSVECSTNKFTWKIDYMESSGTYNTGFANLVGNGIYSKHPLETYDCFDNLQTSQYRTSVYGFPVMVFHKHSQKEDLDMYGQDNQEYKVYTFIGRYNLNLDKSSNEYYGFEIKTEHPYVNLETPLTAQEDVLDENQNPVYEYKPITSLNLANTYYKLENEEYIALDVEDIQIIDGENIIPITADNNDQFTLNGTSTPITIYEKVKKTRTVITREKKTIAEVAECWELRDNQGTWTSFKYPMDAINDKFSTVDSSGVLEVTKHFEYRYNVDGDALDDAYEKKDDPSKTAVKWHNGKVNLSTQSYRNEFLIKKHRNLERLFDWLYSTDTSVVPAEDNLPNSVQLSAEEKARQFDEQIYYMVDSSTNSETNVTTTYLVDSEGHQVILLDNDHVDTDEFGYLIRKDNSVRLDNCIAAANYTGTKRGYTIKIKFNTDCAGYRLHKFQAEFAQHLDLEYCIKYFILTELLLCYDSRGKNMMLATWGPQEEGGEYIWFPIFYDIDTQLGLNNIGAVLWDYNADATIDGDFSTANSVLWVNLWSFRT